MTEEAVSNTLPIGAILHWYEVQDILGRGGYGITYLAYDQNLHRKVAIKEYLPTDFAHRVSDNTVHPMTDGHKDLYSWGMERFLSEARTLAQFNHKAIIKVNSVFEQNNTAYMVMEYEEGDDLSIAYEKNKPFSQEQLLKLFLPIVEGLALIHDAGFIHRDIKPANIYVRTDGSPVLLDFGSARQTIKSQTSALTTLVTTGYAPFEQYNQSDDEQGVWTDIYALGATLYYCITGDKPVDALKRSASLIKMGRDVYEPISNRQIPGFTQNFLRAIDHALMFHPERRPHSAQYWADMLAGKVGVAPVTEDLFRINHPEDTYYDLDSTVVMTPVKAMSLDEQTVVQSPEETSHPDIKINAVQEELEISSMHILDEQTIVQKPNELHYSTSENLSYQPERHSSPIQPATSHDLDKVTEVLAAPGGQLNNLVQPLSTNQKDTAKNALLEYIQKRIKQAHHRFHKWAEALQLQLPRNIPQHLQQILHNRNVLLSAMSVVLFVAVAILFSIIFSNANTEQKILALQSDSSMLSTADNSGDTITNSTIDTKLNSQETTNDVSPLEQLLRQAQLDQSQGLLIEEAEMGAYYQYQKILNLDPQHPIALQALQEIEQYYADLIATNLQNSDWQQAQINFSKYKIASNDQQKISSLERQFTERAATLKNVDKLLKQADKYFAQNKLTKPSSNNALALYNEVLTIDPGNLAAIEGINNIIDKLGDYLQKQLTIDQIKNAEITYNKIAEIDPNAAILADNEPVLAKLLAQRNEIIKLLRQAKADFIRGNIITPNDDNALDKYRSVIDIDPNHEKAKDGIETIYQYYLADFNRFLEEKRYDRADNVLRKMSSANFDRNKIVTLQQRLHKERVTASNKPY
ncbi:protein kinase domain-containing protein [Kaarinaea lacus]